MISVIIPAHNEKGNLEQLLPRLERLESPVEVEIIVALSCQNTDGSENLLQSSEVSMLKCQQTGRAAQMNHAAKISKGTILVFLHADVMPPDSFFKDIDATLDANCDAGFFSYKFDTDSFLLKINSIFTSKDGIFTGGGDQCLFIKRKVFSKLNGFDELQVLMEDFEFFERMKKNKIPYKIINNDLIVSARKYQRNSYARVNLSNLLLLVLFKMGCPSQKLKSLHNKLLRTSYQTTTS